MDSELKTVKSEGKKYVRKTKNRQYYYPPTLPRVRKHYFKETFSKTSIITFFVSLVFFLVPTLISDDKINAIALYCWIILFRFLFEYLHRFILIVEEVWHVKSRYNNDLWALFTNSIKLPHMAVFILVVCLLIIVAVVASTGILKITLDVTELICFLLSIFMMVKLLKLDSTKLHMSYWISQNYGIDYGAGMAYSFYHGYLKLILNKMGNEDMNLKDNMQIYESHHKIKFEIYKLFVLLPKSLNCLESLEEGSKFIESASSMLKKKITRAGVRDRVYKNSVYKILVDKTDVRYVLAEYATPLKTFKEVVQHYGQHSETYKALESDIVHQFYITLKMILKENDLNCCELIYYDDKDTDVGALILSNIRQLKKNE